MNFSKDSIKNPIIKEVHNIGTKKVVSIDESIIQQLCIDNETNVFLEQEVTEDGKGILMRVRNLEI